MFSRLLSSGAFAHLRRGVFYALTAVLVAVSGAGAQDSAVDISNPSDVIQNFDVQNIGPILSELGVQWQAQQSSDGRTFIAAQIDGGFAFNMIPSACQDSAIRNCVGLNTMALFTGSSLNPQSVSAFNQKYWFSTAGIGADGRSAYISRYDIADYGIARGNVASSLKNFLVLAVRFRDELRSAARTVSLDGYASDLSSTLLNRRALEEAVGHTEPASRFERHGYDFETAPELVQIFLKDPNTPKNKIEKIRNVRP